MRGQYWGSDMGQHWAVLGQYSGGSTLSVLGQYWGSAGGRTGAILRAVPWQYSGNIGAVLGAMPCQCWGAPWLY